MSWFKTLLSPISSVIKSVASVLGISAGGEDPAVAAAQKAAAEAQQQALAQQKATDAAAEAQRLSLANMQANSAALSSANAANTEGILANIVAGGTADTVDSTKKRRLPTPQLASTLGINL